MSNLTHHKYPFLKELGIGAENPGCYYGGIWTGSGPSYTAVNPTTGESIAKIRMTSP